MSNTTENQSANVFKDRLRKDERQIGLWTSLSNNLVAEILNPIGFDWLLFDVEHAPNDIPLLLGQLQAMRGSRSEPVVRPEWNHPVIIKRLLDIGFRSFVVPHGPERQGGPLRGRGHTLIRPKASGALPRLTAPPPTAPMPITSKRRIHRSA